MNRITIHEMGECSDAKENKQFYDIKREGRQRTAIFEPLFYQKIKNKYNGLETPKERFRKFQTRISHELFN